MAAPNATVRNLTEGREGAYRTGRRTGLVAGVTTGSATDGHLWVCRWAPTTAPAALAVEKRRFAVITRLLIKLRMITDFTAAQEAALALFKLTGYTGAHSGGTGAVALTPSKKRTAHPTSVMTGRIAGTDQLTAGTQTLDTDPIATEASSNLANAATVQKGRLDILLTTDDLALYPLVLAPNEGLLVRNEIAMGAGGTARIGVEMDWLEVERY